MTLLSKVLSMSVIVACLLISLITGAWGQAPMSPFGGELRGPIQIRGKVLCVGCTLKDVPNVQPDEGKLYQFMHRKGQLVIQVSWVSEPQLWSYMASPPRLWARAGDSLFQKLTAEENLFQEFEITAVPSHGLQTLDLFDITLLRPGASRRRE